jgi:hypothetical protein
MMKARRMRWTGHVGKAERKRPRRGWVDRTRIEMDLAEIGWGSEYWIDLA